MAQRHFRPPFSRRPDPSPRSWPRTSPSWWSATLCTPPSNTSSASAPSLIRPASLIKTSSTRSCDWYGGGEACAASPERGRPLPLTASGGRVLLARDAADGRRVGATRVQRVGAVAGIQLCRGVREIPRRVLPVRCQAHAPVSVAPVACRAHSLNAADGYAAMARATAPVQASGQGGDAVLPRSLRPREPAARARPRAEATWGR